MLKSFFLSLCSLFCRLFQHRHWIFTVLTHLFQLIYLFRARFSRWTLVKVTFISHRYQYRWLKVATHTHAHKPKKKPNLNGDRFENSHIKLKMLLSHRFVFGVRIKFLLCLLCKGAYYFGCTLTFKAIPIPLHSTPFGCDTKIQRTRAPFAISLFVLNHIRKLFFLHFESRIGWWVVRFIVLRCTMYKVVLSQCH